MDIFFRNDNLPSYIETITNFSKSGMQVKYSLAYIDILQITYYISLIEVNLIQCSWLLMLYDFFKNINIA